MITKGHLNYELTLALRLRECVGLIPFTLSESSQPFLIGFTVATYGEEELLEDDEVQDENLDLDDSSESFPLSSSAQVTLNFRNSLNTSEVLLSNSPFRKVVFSGDDDIDHVLDMLALIDLGRCDFNFATGRGRMGTALLEV